MGSVLNRLSRVRVRAPPPQHVGTQSVKQDVGQEITQNACRCSQHAEKDGKHVDKVVFFKVISQVEWATFQQAGAI